ncbi:MAG: hypothetical protein M3Q69_14570 [Acidobacteriota bacterium]|nr:hypothetical protein [Acidobacteriota bacterium]
MNENLRDTVREKAAELAGGAYEKQKGTALGELDTIASALRRAADELNDNGSMAGKLVSAVAERVEQTGRSLDGKELGDIVDDVERFARRNPATFISGAIAVGFLASRFLKSSAARAAERASASTSTGASTTTSNFAGSSGGAADFPVGGTGASDYLTTTASDDTTVAGMDRPFIAGMAAIAVGAIVGTIIRETDREHALFGEARERLTSRAVETARQTVARTVADAASTIANRAGGGSNDKGDVGTNVGV